jgi:hypothetical protein
MIIASPARCRSGAQVSAIPDAKAPTRPENNPAQEPSRSRSPSRIRRRISGSFTTAAGRTSCIRGSLRGKDGRKAGPSTAQSSGRSASSSHQTTYPVGSWVGYQSQRTLSAATRNNPRPPSSCTSGRPSAPRSFGIGGRGRCRRRARGRTRRGLSGGRRVHAPPSTVRRTAMILPTTASTSSTEPIGWRQGHQKHQVRSSAR